VQNRKPTVLKGEINRGNAEKMKEKLLEKMQLIHLLVFSVNFNPFNHAEYISMQENSICDNEICNSKACNEMLAFLRICC